MSAWDERRPSPGAAPRTLATGRLEDGRSFAVVLPPVLPALYVAPPDAARALELLAGAAGAALDPAPWSDLAGAPLTRISLAHGRLETAARLLEVRGVQVRHRERPRASDALTALGISGPVEIHGEPTAGRRVDAVFVNPELSPAREMVPLRWLALDVETDRDQSVVAVSLAGANGPGEVLFLGPALSRGDVTSFATEKALLASLSRRLLERDPDVITGWNVVDFDVRVLVKRFAACGLPFDAGRTAEAAALREREGRRSLAEVPGRAVIDAMRLLRSSAERFSEQSLESAARAVLGEGKTVALRGRAKLAELSRLRREEPERFCAYCLRDSELVLRILRKTGLDALTAKRAALTGVSVELAWTSIPAFERIYAAELRERRVAPPERVDPRVSDAAGGTVLEAAAGLFDNVLVFDFRSLYPSLIRTFNIDPLAHARADAAPREDDLVAPNGARFERRPGILPRIIARYAAEREAALSAGDDTAAHVYKILQNSFYGVLGAERCRYARTELAGAITSFGKLFLTAARDFFEGRGHRVLYGDTDSVFVLSGRGDAADFATLTAFGLEHADELNHHLEERIAREYGAPSHLRIRCEKAYRRFLIPRLKSEAGEGRGRAKGYAGLKLAPDGSAAVEIKGMEGVRSDFTPLARRFQMELLSKAFAGEGEAALAGFCRELVRRMARGELDGELVYTKSLRRPAREYGSQTPQVRAARMLGWTRQRGRVSYVMTRAGAEPVDGRSAASLDYAHYRDRQLLPIARSIADVLGLDADAWFGAAKQLELFE